MPGLAGEVANLIVALKLDDSGFSGKLNSIAGQLRGFDSGLSRMGRGVGQVGAGIARLGTVAGAAAAGGLAAVVTTSASFEQAFTGIEKTVDETATTTFPKLEEAIRSMARSIPISFEELAAIGETGGALGIAADDLEEFIDVVARLGVSTDLSTDQAATALGQLGNVLHLRGDDFRDLSDSLVALGNAGASTESQIVDMAARFAAAGNSAGLSKEDILALASAVASMGIEVEAGGSSLSRIFNNVATNIGTSSEKAVAFADTLGLSAAEFRKAWEKDALGTFQDFLKELNKLDQFAQARVLKDIGITNTRDISAVRLMAQNVGFVGEQLKISRDAQGELNEESQKFFDTAIGQWGTLKNIVRDAGATIGDEVLPVTKEMIDQFSNFLNTPEMRANLKRFGQDLANGIRGFIDELKGTDFSGLLGGLKIAADAAKIAFDAFRSLPAPLQGAIVGAIALNKVSGGGVGLLVKGLGNIALGGTQIGAKLLGMRGQSPVSPLFVKEVGLGGAGGGPGVFGAGGASKFGSILGRAFGIASAVFIGAEIGNVLGSALGLRKGVETAVEFETSEFEQFLAGENTKNTQVLVHNLEVLNGGIKAIEDRGLLATILFGDQLQELKNQRDTVEQLLDVAHEQANEAQTSRQTEEQILAEAKSSRLAAAHQSTDTNKALRDLTLEQRLLRDKGFKTKLDADEVLRVLRRTSEFGAKGVGTGIEVGPKTGRDPTGQAFVALVRRLTEKELKDIRVQTEIRNHIVAAKEVLARAQEQGDKSTVRKLEGTIAELRSILRGTDNVARKTDGVAREVQNAQRAIGASRQAVIDYGNRQVGYLNTIAAKDFSPQINFQSNTTVNVLTAAGQIIQQTRIENAIAGVGVGGAVAPGTM